MSCRQRVGTEIESRFALCFCTGCSTTGQYMRLYCLYCPQPHIVGGAVFVNHTNLLWQCVYIQSRRWFGIYSDGKIIYNKVLEILVQRMVMSAASRVHTPSGTFACCLHSYTCYVCQWYILKFMFNPINLFRKSVKTISVLNLKLMLLF